MGSARPAVLAVVAFLLVFWSVFAPAVGQNPVGHMVVTTDYELFGTSDLNGGGHVTWTLTGAKAADLRAKILHLFDEYGQIPRGFPFEGAATSANPDGILEAAEGASYTERVENVLEGSGGQGPLVQYMRLWAFDLRQKNADPAGGFPGGSSSVAASNTQRDPMRARPSDFDKPCDLRFGAPAWIKFNYTGQVADARYRLRLQTAPAPAFTDGTNRLLGRPPDLPQTAPGIW